MTDLERRVLSTLMPGFVGPEAPAWLGDRLRQGLGAVCLFGTNVVSPTQVRALTASLADANPDVVIAIDEEGGDVTRMHHLDGSPYPGNALLGRLDDLDYTERVARRVGAELVDAGCTLTFAPDVDVNSNPRNPVIGVRSFGDDAALVARHSAAWTTGVQSAGIAACAKHFPGHGDTSSDSHLALPEIGVDAATLRARELVPFRAAVAAGTLTVMTSHIMVPAIDPVHPATFSAAILQGLLRDELGFEGVIVSDALDMVGASGEIGIPEAAVRALAAGCDLLCIGTDNTDAQIGEIVAHIVRAVAEGRLAEERVADASGRVARLAEQSRRAAAANPLGAASTTAASDDPSEETARVRSVFEIGTGTSHTLASVHAGAPFTVITVESPANIAVGASPWGPFAAAGLAPDTAAARRFTGAAQLVIPEHGPFDPADVDTDIVVVVGKDVHRRPAAVTAIDALRGRAGRDRHDTVVVDMGWPDPERHYADVATWGASRLAGAALLDLIVGERT